MEDATGPRELARQVVAGHLSRRDFVRRAAALGLSAPAIAGVLAACGRSDAPELGAPGAATGAAPTPTTVGPTAVPVTGGELRVATTTEGVSLHPFKVTDTASFSYIDRMFYMPLLRYNPDTLELQPFVAAAVRESEDKTTLTFTLREKLQWSDGRPLTAADYAWTWAKASDKANGWPRLGSYSPYIESVREIDAQTLEVKLKTPLAISQEKVSTGLAYVLPKHIWEAQDWSDANKNPEIMKPTVVAGPYKLQEWKKDEYAAFTVNERFFLGRPRIDKVSHRVFGNANVATQALLGGEVDQYGVEPENWLDVKKSERLNAFQWDAPDAAVTYIGLNLRQEALKEKAVRQALNYALDKEQIAGKLTYELGKRATTMYLPTSPIYESSVNPYKHDPAQARKLLDDAGWKVGADGIREKNGQRLKLLFIYGPNTTPVREQLATVAQQQWKAIGAEVEVRGMEWGAYLKVTKEGPYDWSAFVNAYIPSVDPDTIWWKKTADASYNRVDYRNPRVEELYEQGLTELDREKRKGIYQEIQRILTDDAPWIWLYYEQPHTAIDKRVQGIRVTKALGLNDSWEWWIKP